MSIIIHFPERRTNAKLPLLDIEVERGRRYYHGDRTPDGRHTYCRVLDVFCSGCPRQRSSTDCPYASPSSGGR
jgi:hypothetical protein